MLAPRTSNRPERQVQERGRGATILPRLRAELRSFERARSSNFSLSTFRRVIEEKGKGRLPQCDLIFIRIALSDSLFSSSSNGLSTHAISSES